MNSKTVFAQVGQKSNNLIENLNSNFFIVCPNSFTIK